MNIWLLLFSPLSTVWLVTCCVRVKCGTGNRSLQEPTILLPNGPANPLPLCYTMELRKP